MMPPKVARGCHYRESMNTSVTLSVFKDLLVDRTQ